MELGRKILTCRVINKGRESRTSSSATSSITCCSGIAAASGMSSFCRSDDGRLSRSLRAFELRDQRHVASHRIVATNAAFLPTRRVVAFSAASPANASKRSMRQHPHDGGCDGRQDQRAGLERERDRLALPCRKARLRYDLRGAVISDVLQKIGHHAPDDCGQQARVSDHEPLDALRFRAPPMSAPANSGRPNA